MMISDFNSNLTTVAVPGSDSVVLPQGAQIVMPGLADPAVVFLPQRRQYMMSGTFGDTSSLRVFLSDNGHDFLPHVDVVPTDRTGTDRYQFLWAPDLHVNAKGQVVVYFSGYKTKPNDTSRERDRIDSVTTYRMVLDQMNLRNVIEYPALVDYNQYLNVFGLFRIRLKQRVAGFESHKCMDNGKPLSDDCERTIRIDADFFIDPVTGNQHLFYVWAGRQSGMNNLISSYDIKKERVVSRIEPRDKAYEGITEAPDVFYRNGWYYLIFSHGSFNLTYGMSYIRSRDLKSLTMDSSQVFPLLFPVLNSSRTNCESGYSGNQILFAGGHSKVTQMLHADPEQYYIYYHVNEYVANQSVCHHLRNRHTVRQQLQFSQDGYIFSLN